jgi:hypothetical protein
VFTPKHYVISLLAEGTVRGFRREKSFPYEKILFNNFMTKLTDFSHRKKLEK